MLKILEEKNILKNDLQEESKRIEYVDIFRAIGIILMIMGHIGFGGKFDFFIHAFHMPMFFLISGYFFKNNEKIQLFLKKKAKTLLIPYISFGIIHFILYCIMKHNIEIDALKHLLFVNTDGLPIAGALWFLTALFFADVFYYYINKVKNPFKPILIVIIAIFGNLAVKILPFRLPFALDAAFTGVGLMYIGNLIKIYKNNKYVNKILNMNNLCTVILFLISIFLISVNTYINMRIGEYGILPLFWINAILSSLIILLFSKKMNKYLNNNIKEFFVSIGKNSIIYLCLNQIVISVINKIINIIRCNNINSFVTLLVKLIELIIVMVVLWICNIIIQNTKLKFLIGK